MNYKLHKVEGIFHEHLITIYVPKMKITEKLIIGPKKPIPRVEFAGFDDILLREFPKDFYLFQEPSPKFDELVLVTKPHFIACKRSDLIYDVLGSIFLNLQFEGSILIACTKFDRIDDIYNIIAWNFRVCKKFQFCIKGEGFHGRSRDEVLNYLQCQSESPYDLKLFI